MGDGGVGHGKRQIRGWAPCGGASAPLHPESRAAGGRGPGVIDQMQCHIPGVATAQRGTPVSHPWLT